MAGRRRMNSGAGTSTVSQYLPPSFGQTNLATEITAKPQLGPSTVRSSKLRCSAPMRVVAPRYHCGRGEIGRRSRLQLECPRGNPRRRTAQSRGTLTGTCAPSQSRAKPSCEGRCRDWTGGASGRKALAKGQSRPRTPVGGGESRSGMKICLSLGVRVRVPSSAPTPGFPLGKSNR